MKKLTLESLKSLCPNCSTNNNFPFSEAESCSVCTNCRSIYRNGDQFVLRKNLLKKQSIDFLLPLETSFQWEGEKYVISGYVIKREKEDKLAIWIEYFLTHPTLPNLYLIFFNGHWTVLKYLPEVKRTKKNVRNQFNVTYQKIEYDFQHNYTVEIIDAQGCFNFPFYEDNENKVREFVYYNQVLIWEENSKDPNLRFYLGEYMFSVDLEKCFEEKFDFPKRKGYVAHQPFYFPIDGKSFRWMSLLLIATMIVGMTFWQSFFPTQSIIDGHLSVQTNNSETITSDPFEIKYDNSILNIRAKADGLNNEWVYSDMALINTKTGEERYFDMELEYYFGQTDGENWSEGDTDINGNIQYVDAGTYVLEATPLQAAGIDSKRIDFYLTTQKGSWSVFWFLVIWIVVINVILGFWGDYFNHKKRGEEYDTFSKHFNE